VSARRVLRCPAPLTRMPCSGPASASTRRANRLSLLDKAPLARRVHVLAVVLSAALGGCVIPPPLQTDDPDAGVNHPPAFRSVKDGTGEELERPGHHTFAVGQGELRITTADTDLGDTLYYRMYVDYGVDAQNRPTQVRAECMVGPGVAPEVERTTTCSLLGVCTPDLVDTQEHVFELDVLDRQPISTATRLYRDVTPPGEIATYWWFITCVSQ